MVSSARLSTASRSVLFLVLVATASAQNASSIPATAPLNTKQTTSIGDALKRAGNEPVRLVYIHGIGATAPYDSSELRDSLCRQLKDCVVKGGQAKSREYADEGIFDPNSDKIPDLTYMGQKLWRTKEEWMASAPFVDHYVIQLKRGQTILLDEINWWPMVFSLKCRNMLPNETQLAGHDGQYLALCATNAPHSADGISNRFNTYGWITPADAASLTNTPNHGVFGNRKLKVNLMDWRFSDALLGVGPLEKYLVEGIQQLLMKSVSTASTNTAKVTSNAPILFDPNAEYIIISHSLGSFLIFAALHMDNSSNNVSAAAEIQRTEVFNYLLGHLSQAYFFANQIPLLELAKLGSESESKTFLDLSNWASERQKVLKEQGKTISPIAQIVAWSDPNDQLTWYLGKDFQQWQATDAVQVVNRLVKNAPHWLWLVEGPTSAHDNYAKNPEVIRTLVKPLQP